MVHHIWNVSFKSFYLMICFLLFLHFMIPLSSLHLMPGCASLATFWTSFPDKQQPWALHLALRPRNQGEGWTWIWVGLWPSEGGVQVPRPASIAALSGIIPDRQTCQHVRPEALSSPGTGTRAWERKAVTLGWWGRMEPEGGTASWRKIGVPVEWSWGTSQEIALSGSSLSICAGFWKPDRGVWNL